MDCATSLVMCLFLKIFLSVFCVRNAILIMNFLSSRINIQLEMEQIITYCLVTFFSLYTLIEKLDIWQMVIFKMTATNINNWQNCYKCVTFIVIKIFVYLTISFNVQLFNRRQHIFLWEQKLT